MRVALIAVALVALALAGCTAPEPGRVEVELVPNGVEDRDRGDDEVWIVWVHGRERRQGGADITCDVAYSHEVDRDNRTVTYDRQRYGFDPNRTTVLLAFDVWSSGSCPAAYELVADPDGPIQRDVAHLGNLSVDAGDDGTLRVQDRDVPIGKAARLAWNVTDDGVRYKGSLRVETLGAWPKANLDGR